MASSSSSFPLLFLFLLISFPPCLSSSPPDYLSALHNTLLFFEGQRSGPLPVSQRVTWRSNSALLDGFAQGVDLVGGYYDAGDNVKFGLPMAFTITMLSWSVVEYEDYISSAGELCHAQEAIKWGTDYLLKAHPQPNLLWGEVGDGSSDHFCWQRPEEMTTSRQAYSIDENNPGSDLAGETAAAMAAASMVFKKIDPAYSATLLTHAKQLFNFADTFRGKYDSSISVVRGFYRSESGYGDELLWAALWLFEASGEKHYYDYAIQNAQALGGIGWAMKEFSWDVKYAGVQVLMSKILLEGRGCSQDMAVLTQYQSQAQFFMCACLQKNNGRNVYRTPGGLLYTRAWNNLQYTVSASFLMTVYSDYLANSNQQLQCPAGHVDAMELFNTAKSQVDYILGDNPRGTSYMVGFGSNFPQRVHHRAALIVSYKEDPTFVTCKEGYQKWFKSSSGDPNVHVGAIVGGPDENDNYADDRENYDQSEPTTYNSSPMVGILARLHSASAASGGYMQVEKADESHNSLETPIIISQERTASWSRDGERYYRYQVMLKNNSTSTLKTVRLVVQGMQGPVWGLSKVVDDDNTYTFPPWIKALSSQASLVFVYIHPGPQEATISIISSEFSS